MKHEIMEDERITTLKKKKRKCNKREKNAMFFYTEFLFQQEKGMQLRVGQQEHW